MIGFIAFALKILFASIMGGVLNYVPGNSENSQNIVETSLVCIFSASILGLTRQFANKEEYIVMGIGVLSVIIGVIFISKNLELICRIMWLFAAVIGMIIGSGYFVQAALLTSLIYLIIHNNENLLSYIYKQSDVIGDTNIENK